MMSRRRISFGSLLAIAVFANCSTAHAAGRWVDRSITLPRHDWAFDFGLGIGHLNAPNSPTGLGLNLEAAVAIMRHLELGLRTGVRFGNDGRVTRADTYGRLFDRQTFGTNYDTVANPEVRLRGALVSGDVAEVALEGRAILPFEDGSRFGLVAGLPLAFHLGATVRLDTGVYVPILFYDPNFFAISVPLDVWIQATPRFWLGPMLGVRSHHQGDLEYTDWSAGLGLGYSLAAAADFKAMFLMPGLNHTEGARNFGIGAGFQIRIE